jgi:hypothetical protein
MPEIVDQPLSALRPFRFIEADMHERIRSLEHLWEHEPALAPMRKAEVIEKLMSSLPEFRTRTRERRIWQSQYQVLLAIWREAYGAEKVAHMPKRASLRSYAERNAALEALPEDERRLSERRATVITEVGFRLPYV